MFDGVCDGELRPSIKVTHAKFWCSAGSLAMVRDAAAMVRDV